MSYLHRFCLDPLEFCIESDEANPSAALEKELKCGTSEEIYLLHYLHKNIEDYPTLNDSVEYLETEQDDDD